MFLIGARFDFFHVIRSLGDLGGRRGMNHMLDYLLKHPEKGLLGYEMGLKTIVQYWRPFVPALASFGLLSPTPLGLNHA